MKFLYPNIKIKDELFFNFWSVEHDSTVSGPICYCFKIEHQMTTDVQKGVLGKLIATNFYYFCLEICLKGTYLIIGVGTWWPHCPEVYFCKQPTEGSPV